MGGEKFRDFYNKSEHIKQIAKQSIEEYIKEVKKYFKIEAAVLYDNDIYDIENPNRIDIALISDDFANSNFDREKLDGISVDLAMEKRSKFKFSATPLTIGDYLNNNCGGYIRSADSKLIYGDEKYKPN